MGAHLRPKSVSGLLNSTYPQIACCWLLMVFVQLTGAQTLRFEPVKGRMRIEGTSNLDDWQVESRSVGGYFETGPDFPGSPSRTNVPAQIPARAECLVGVRTLKSIEKDGKPFSNLMDEIMYGK